MRLQPCDARRKVEPGTVAVDGIASLFVGGADFERVRAAIGEKYGFQVKLISGFQKLTGLLGRGTPLSDAAVVVTVS